MLDPGSPLRRRPAAMLIAVTALFVALGGVGYAAVSLPPGSVGRSQIRNDAVNYAKILPGSVGIARINPATVQARVLNTCTQGNAAITAINVHGQPTCASTRPAEFDTSNTTAQPLTSATTTNAVASESLSGGSSYLISAAPFIVVKGTAGVDQQVTVTCELSDGTATANGTGTQVRTATFDLASDHETETGAIPLEITAEPSSTTGTAAVVCDRAISSATTTAAAPTVDAVTQINAIQTSANTTEPNTTVPYAIAPSTRTK